MGNLGLKTLIWVIQVGKTKEIQSLRARIFFVIYGQYRFKNTYMGNLVRENKQKIARYMGNLDR